MTNYGQSQQDGFFDALAMFTAILQIMDYNATMKQVGNDDLMAEMRKQDAEYLQKIIGQNNEIIEQNKAILRALEGRNV